MAFDAYLGALPQPGDSRLRRRLLYGVSIAAHAGLIAAGVAYSFWHVEELKPPSVSVTFVSALPPPPPPPPAAALGGGEAAPKHRPPTKPRPVVQPPLVTTPTPAVVAPTVPREAPAPAKPASAVSGAPPGPGQPDGVAGGSAHGVAGGAVNGVAGGVLGSHGPASAPVAAPKFLPPNLGALQKLSGADPDFPPYLRKPGAHYLVLAKICVGPSGAVDSVSLMKRADPALDNGVTGAVRAWRFRPLTANGTAVPFCYFGRFEFKAD